MMHLLFNLLLHLLDMVSSNTDFLFDDLTTDNEADYLGTTSMSIGPDRLEPKMGISRFPDQSHADSANNVLPLLSAKSKCYIRIFRRRTTTLLTLLTLS